METNWPANGKGQIMDPLSLLLTSEKKAKVPARSKQTHIRRTGFLGIEYLVKVSLDNSHGQTAE